MVPTSAKPLLGITLFFHSLPSILFAAFVDVFRRLKSGKLVKCHETTKHDFHKTRNSHSEKQTSGIERRDGRGRANIGTGILFVIKGDTFNKVWKCILWNIHIWMWSCYGYERVMCDFPRRGCSNLQYYSPENGGGFTDRTGIRRFSEIHKSVLIVSADRHEINLPTFILINRIPILSLYV